MLPQAAVILGALHLRSHGPKETDEVPVEASPQHRRGGLARVRPALQEIRSDTTNMAATHKCLAQRNKSRRGRSATNKGGTA